MRGDTQWDINKIQSSHLCQFIIHHITISVVGLVFLVVLRRRISRGTPTFYNSERARGIINRRQVNVCPNCQLRGGGQCCQKRWRSVWITWHWNSDIQLSHQNLNTIDQRITLKSSIFKKTPGSGTTSGIPKSSAACLQESSRHPGRVFQKGLPKGRNDDDDDDDGAIKGEILLYCSLQQRFLRGLFYYASHNSEGAMIAESRTCVWGEIVLAA